MTRHRALFSIQGGKMVKAKKMKDLWTTSYDTWIEPFVGGGSLFVAERPKKAIINDFNPFIVDLWKYVKDTPKDRLTAINEFRINFRDEYGRKEYDNLKASINREYKRSGEINSLYNLILIYNAGFGIVRLDDRGLNVAYDGSDRVTDLIGRLEYMHDFLNSRDVKIFNKDYKDICKMAKENDLLVLDPPYFNVKGYPKNWGEKEYKDFKETVEMANSKGVKFFICSHRDDYILDLFKDYEILDYQVVENMSKDRGKIRNEIIIKNY